MLYHAVIGKSNNDDATEYDDVFYDFEFVEIKETA